MTYQQWREEFAVRLAREFSDLNPFMVQAKMARIVRDANRIQAHAVNLCNREVTPAETTKAERARARIVAEFPKGTAFEFGGDPRGPCANVHFRADVPGCFTAIPHRYY